MLILGEIGWRLYGSYLYYLCNFSIYLYSKTKSLLKKCSEIRIKFTGNLLSLQQLYKIEVSSPLHIYLCILHTRIPLHLLRYWSCHLPALEKGQPCGSWFEVPSSNVSVKTWLLCELHQVTSLSMLCFCLRPKRTDNSYLPPPREGKKVKKVIWT